MGGLVIKEVIAYVRWIYNFWTETKPSWQAFNLASKVPDFKNASEVFCSRPLPIEDLITQLLLKMS